MRKRILSFLCALALLAGLIPAAAAAQPEPDRMCSLKLLYERNDTAFSGLTVGIYRVAELTGEGEYRLLEPYSGYPIKIDGITSQQQWRDTAQTIRNFIDANDVPATAVAQTDDDGYACFTDLPTGLYLVRGIMAEREGVTVLFQDFMIYLPTVRDGAYVYDPEARPKSDEFLAQESYTVIKLWEDGSHKERPGSINVRIYEDGELYDTVTLHSGNNWSHSWQTEADGSVWTVAEDPVPERYWVTITHSGHTFVITNTLHTDPTDPTDPDPDPDQPEHPPETGDSAPLLLYTAMLCVSGLGLVCLGSLWLRDRKHEKNR